MSTMTISATPARTQGWRRHFRHGWRVLLYRAVRKGLAKSRLTPWLQFWIHQYIAVEPWHLRVPSRAPRGMAVDEIGMEGVDGLAGLRAGAEAEFRRRISLGHRCFVARLQGRTVAFVWGVVGPSEIQASFGCRWVVPDGMIWLYDLYSDPGVLGAMPYLNAMIRHRFSAGQLRWLSGQVDFDNYRSRQAHGSLGYAIRGNIWTVGAGRSRLHLVWRQSCVLPEVLLGNAGIQLRRFGGTRASVGNSGEAGDLAPAPRGLRTGTNPAVGDAAAQVAGSQDAEPLWLQCPCGERLELTGEAWTCGRCGRQLGKSREGIPVLGPPIPYWGEIPAQAMQDLLQSMERSEWRAAVREHAPAALHEYILSPDRAAFEDIINFPPHGVILEVGAGLGGISAELARRYRVVALEGVWERARFLALRAQQDGLDQLTVLNGDVNSIPLAPGQFDAIIVNGVLEWVAMAELQGDPGDIQARFLERLRLLLKPGGLIYLAIENRMGWSELRGALDHSGLPYTSLLPRALARGMCAHSRRYRSAFNIGYRTYTYTYRGYRQLFARAGLAIRETYISTESHNHPIRMIPLQQEAISFVVRMGMPAVTPRARLRQWVIRMLGRRWFWELTGGDFAFVLQARSEGFDA